MLTPSTCRRKGREGLLRVSECLGLSWALQLLGLSINTDTQRHSLTFMFIVHHKEFIDIALWIPREKSMHFWRAMYILRSAGSNQCLSRGHTTNEISGSPCSAACCLLWSPESIIPPIASLQFSFKDSMLSLDKSLLPYCPLHSGGCSYSSMRWMWLKMLF